VIWHGGWTRSLKLGQGEKRHFAVFSSGEIASKIDVRQERSDVFLKGWPLLEKA
jgi:hypothetical protein